MRILFSIHLFPPQHNCGSETYAVALIHYLQSKGHDCRVLLHKANGPLLDKMYVYQDIPVWPASGQIGNHFFWADRVFTQLTHMTAWTMTMACQYKKPCFHITHSDQVNQAVAACRLPVRVIYNTYESAKNLNYQHPAIVLHPPINPEDYQTGVTPHKAEYITLINLNRNKGVGIFYEIARRMPERKFLAVQGSYDEQILSDLPNVTAVPNSPDILFAYKQTRILLMPSEMESYGLTAREAMSSGIPVICTDLPGLRENCGDAAVYMDRDNIQGWVTEIRKLDNKKQYLSRSELCKNRAYNSDIPEQLKALDEFINMA